MMRIVVYFAAAAIFCCFDIARIRPDAESPENRAQNEVPQTCPVTKPPTPPFAPPAPYPSDHQIWIGSPKLWTNIPRGGFLGHYTPDGGRFCKKVFWWSEGYDWRKENPPELTITLKRLDGTAPTLFAADHANAGWTNDSKHPFMVQAIFIPTIGCWKITGRYKEQELSYVVWLAK